MPARTRSAFTIEAAVVKYISWPESSHDRPTTNLLTSGETGDTARYSCGAQWLSYDQLQNISLCLTIYHFLTDKLLKLTVVYIFKQSGFH